MNVKRVAAVVFPLLIGSSIPALATPIVDVPKIAGKTQADVAKVLGNPTRQERSKNGLRAFYRGEKIKIVFIHGKADWITISDMNSVPYGASAIEALNLKPEPPTFQNGVVTAWEPHSKYRSIRVFPDTSGRVYFTLINVATKS